MTTQEDILQQCAKDRGELYVQLASEVQYLRRINEKLAEENSHLTQLIAQLTEDVHRKSLRSAFMGKNTSRGDHVLPL